MKFFFKFGTLQFQKMAPHPLEVPRFDGVFFKKPNLGRPRWTQQIAKAAKINVPWAFGSSAWIVAKDEVADFVSHDGCMDVWYLPTPWKINMVHLQITYEKKGKWSSNQTSMRTCSMLILRGVHENHKNQPFM